MLLQVACFAMHRDRNRGPHPLVHLFQFAAPGMPGHVHQRFIIGDEFDAPARKRVLHPAHGLFVAGNSPRGEDRDVALIERNIWMLVLGNACHGGAHLALAARTKQHSPAGRVIRIALLIEIREIFGQIAGIDGNRNNAMQSPAGNDKLSV